MSSDKIHLGGKQQLSKGSLAEREEGVESPDPRAMGMFDCSLYQFISAGSSRTQIRKPFFPLDLSKCSPACRDSQELGKSVLSLGS